MVRTLRCCPPFETPLRGLLVSRYGRAGVKFPVRCGGEPVAPRAAKPVPERGASAVGSVSPNSRQGRSASPHVQGRELKSMFVGIDVSKDRLDVHVRPDRRGVRRRARRRRPGRSGRAAGGLRRPWSCSKRPAATRRSWRPPWPRPGCRSRWSIRARSATSPAPPAAGQDRRARRRRHRPFRRGGPAGPAARRPEARLLGELVARRRQVIEMIVAERNRRRLLTASRAAEERRSRARPAAGRARNRSTTTSTPPSATPRPGASRGPSAQRARHRPRSPAR